MMALEVRTLGYRNDPDAADTRNFAVVADDGQERHMRAIGLAKEGKIDYGRLESLVDGARDAAWVFGEWIGWLRDLTTMASRDDLDRELSEVAKSQRFVTVSEPVAIEYPIERTPESIAAALDELAGRMLHKPRLRPVRFADRVEEFLASSGIKQMKGFDRNIEIVINPGGTDSAIINFPFFVAGSRNTTMVFKTIAFTGRRDHLVRQVNDARRSFDMVVGAGIAPTDGCIVLTDTIPDGRTDYVAPLKGRARLIDITKAGSTEILR